MTLDAEEKDQVDQVKAWFKQYGLLVLAVAAIVIMAFLAWQRYEQMHERATAHASKRYEQLLDSMAANDTVSTQKYAGYLIDRYPNSTYAKLALLLLARSDIAAGQYALAATKLQSVMDSAPVPALRAIARLRYARSLIQMHQPETALSILQKLESKDYVAAAEEVKGDALNAMHNVMGAKQAYQNALNALPESAVNRSLLQMKLNNLANDA